MPGCENVILVWLQKVTEKVQNKFEQRLEGGEEMNN